GPHRGVHGELVAGGIAPERVDDPLELVVGETELPVQRPLESHAAQTLASANDNSDAINGWPPVGPTSGSTACSGCGINPTTLPRSFRTPAIAFVAPFGL